MIPYPGESLTVRAATDVGGLGEDLLAAIRYREGSATLTGSSEWLGWVSAGWPDYLDDDTVPLDVAWVVEVLSGSVTVDISEGITATRGGTDPTPISLGTHTLTAGTNVIPSTFTATDVLYASNNLMVRIEGSTGSAVVQQVKLRAWPTTGVAGGWGAPLPAYTRQVAADIAGEATSARTVFEDQTSGPGTAAALWDSVKAAVQAQQDAPFTGSVIGIANMLGQVITETNAEDGILFDSHVNWSLTLPALRASRPDYVAPALDDTLPLEDGVDYIRPPEEVFGDDASLILPLGSVGISWDGSTNVVQTIHDFDAGGQIFVAVLPFTPGVDPDEIAFDWPDTTAANTGGPIALPDSDVLIFAATHSLMRDDVELVLGEATDWWRFTVGNGMRDWDVESPSFVPLSYLADYPAYRLWNPTATLEAPLRLFRRGDNLGSGSSRVYSTGTRQRSPRVFGVL